MKLSTRFFVQLAAAVLLAIAIAGTAQATPPDCEDICTLSTPCSQICWGPGPGGFGAVITCRKWGHTCSGAQDDTAVAATCDAPPATSTDAHQATTWLDWLAAQWDVSATAA